MKTSLHEAPAARIRDAAPRPRRMLTAYSDEPFRERAESAYRRVARQRNIGRGQIYCWRFTELFTPRWEHVACKEAAISDVVLIACPGEARYLAPLKAWVRRWIMQSVYCRELILVTDSVEILRQLVAADVASHGVELSAFFLREPGSPEPREDSTIPLDSIMAPESALIH